MKTAKERLAMVLRDAKNHEQARIDLECGIAIEPEPAAIALTSICRTRGAFSDEFGVPPAREKILELLRLIRELRPITSHEELIAALNDVKPYRHELRNLLFADTNVAIEVARQISEGIRTKPIETGDLEIHGLGLAAGLAGVYLAAKEVRKNRAEPKLNRRSLLCLGLGLVGMGADLLHAVPLGKPLGWLPTDYRGDGRYWFGLVYRRPNPSLPQAEKLLARVKDLI
jgi:hypothetical protein